MRASVKLTAFAALLAVVFAVSAAVGAAVGPIDVGPDHVEITAPPGHGGHTP